MNSQVAFPFKFYYLTLQLVLLSLFSFFHTYMEAPRNDIFSNLSLCPSCFREHIHKQGMGGRGGDRSLTEFSEVGFETKKKIFFFRIWTYATQKRGSAHNPNLGVHLYATKLLHCVHIHSLLCTCHWKLL